MYALNFYSPLVADQLRSHRKTATIRLGDKSAKYKKGMIVTVLVGVRYGQREKVFDAVIDKVEVKQIRELSPREIEHDNPEIRRPDEMSRFLGQLYNREVSEDETVTVIRFSQIIGSFFARICPAICSSYRAVVLTNVHVLTPLRRSSSSSPTTTRASTSSSRAPASAATA